MTNVAVHLDGHQPSLHTHAHDAVIAGAAHAKGQQHPIKLYLVVWGWLFVLSTCSYLVDYFGLHGYLRWSLILLFMVLKAGLIVAVFMHMAWERLALAYAILLPPVAVLIFVAMMVFEIRIHAHDTDLVLRASDVAVAAPIQGAMPCSQFVKSIRQIRPPTRGRRARPASRRARATPCHCRGSDW